MRLWTSTPPTSSNEMISPVAISNTLGEVTARVEPRVITTKSDRADRNDDPPKLWPTMAVATGISCRRRAMAKISPASEMPSEPIRSGIRPPPVWPKCTSGMPMARARSYRRCSLRPPTTELEPRFTVMSSPNTATGRSATVPWPPIFPSPGVEARSATRIERENVPSSRNEPGSRKASMWSRTVRWPSAWSAATLSAPPISVRIRAARSVRSTMGSMSLIRLLPPRAGPPAGTLGGHYRQRGTAYQCSAMPKPVRSPGRKRARPSLTNVTPSRRGDLGGADRQHRRRRPRSWRRPLSVGRELDGVVQQRVRRVEHGGHAPPRSARASRRRAGSSPCRGTCRRPCGRRRRRGPGRRRSSSRTS